MHPVVVGQEAVKPISEPVGVTELGVCVVIEGDSHDSGLGHPHLAQPLDVQVEEQIRLAASPNPGDYLY